ncbi:uncharacterized protein PGTG_06557 [Puccinia graminis f. sp. tritici CRL 75-36-700-3]|uniref:BolA-like protein 3 n=1 Tax=Puccinia graminis f. sp. tritici (strain CRL 75-36-700-3 / race SCCL) TaxID=418459 RepID=E3K8G1_PUCGT|nr:uncharacterized protein PGTG_06557 [Puccinia graminis f. sp. tritici CRL 75-36-700-3]EFP80601.2 hypothetical protein PGTG_06557 [Puccinia graminis f. sp. tritici CRL 75-36-700-3]
MIRQSAFTRSLFSKPRAVLPSRVFVRETVAARPGHQRPFNTTLSSLSISSSSSANPPLDSSASSADQTPVSEASISAKLARKLPQAVKLRVEDVSGGCGSFFVVEVVDQTFEGLSMLKQHQLINRTLADDIDRIHGLQVRLLDPSSSTLAILPISLSL